MNEKLLQFIWQFQYFRTSDLQTENGEVLQILKTGNSNTNQGADFINASIKIDNTILAGNIEIHIKASQWNTHQHANDENYKNVMLHVVWENDKQIFDHHNKPIPTLVLQPLVPKILLEKYNQLMQNTAPLPCNDFLPALSTIGWISWKERLVIERLLVKTNTILELFKANNSNWEETFWQLLAYNFGLKVNADFFKQIATTISVVLLAKHKNNLLQIEALLLGQANFLNDENDSKYFNELKKEYQFLKHKHQLKRVEGTALFLRMRPANFPTIRLVQLASLIVNSSHLFSKVKEVNTIKNLQQLFTANCSSYWQHHYSLTDTESAFEQKKLGSKMIDNIIINTVVPIVFAYGHYNDEDDFKTKAISWLQCLKPEDNKITKQWQLLQIDNKSAFDSQSLIHLTNQYCNQKKCLSCAVGNKIMSVKKM